MKLTRDSAILTFTVIAALGAVPLAHFNAIPWITPATQQTVELVAAAAGIVAGILRTSPLSLSPEGKLEEGILRYSEALKAKQAYYASINKVPAQVENPAGNTAPPTSPTA